ncbi:MAG: hypothetical protein ACKVKF_23035, partial [Rhodobacterales bacterium]
GRTDLAALSDELSTDTPALTDSTPAEMFSLPEPRRILTPSEADTAYASSGIWQLAPPPPQEPPLSGIEDLYVASIDAAVPESDAIALPAISSLRSDIPFDAPHSPLSADVTFDLDERGLVRATTKGAINPDGVMIYAGLPPLVPPAAIGQPVLTQPDLTPEENVAAVAQQIRLQANSPKARPDNLIERNQRATLAGASLAELSALRPKLRPDLPPAAATAPTTASATSLEGSEEANEPEIAATELAIASSVKPSQRPNDIQRIVNAVQSAPAQPVEVASVAPRSVQPSIPSSTSVAREATVSNAINLRDVNLIGVFGKDSGRHALVRLSNGRYQKVKIGDSIDGGRVAAIGEAELHYIKGGRNVVLQMPRG